MAKRTIRSQADASAALEEAVQRWRAARKRERGERDALARLVRQIVRDDLMSENKVATLTEIPRMTIRKMLGKD